MVNEFQIYEQFSARKEANQKRKLLPAPQKPPVTLPDIQPYGDDEDVSDEDKKNQEKDFTTATKSKKKDDKTVSVPRNLVSAALVGCLDRTKTSKLLCNE